MNPASTSSRAATHVLRCVHCGKIQETADRMFRCTHCSELLEVIYPEWAGAREGFALRLREIWQQRQGSPLPENSSGVWRFRELLPQVSRENIVTMSEGNTPVIQLSKAARSRTHRHPPATHPA